MPSTVASLFDAANVSSARVVRWGQRIPAVDAGPGTGVYVVALTADGHDLTAAVPVCPIDPTAVEQLLHARLELTLDGRRPTAAQLFDRMAEFWFSDEVVLYIGRAGPRQRVHVSALSDRIAEYYATPLGARSPHAGGWPLKLLADIDRLQVHYAHCENDRAAEAAMLARFAHRFSDDTPTTETVVMPFANLEDGRRRRKQHGIKGARAPSRASAEKSPRDSRPAVSAPAPKAPSGPADVSAPDLARRLGVSPKTLRAWLREQARNGDPLVADHEHQGRWRFTEGEARQLGEQYRRRR